MPGAVYSSITEKLVADQKRDAQVLEIAGPSTGRIPAPSSSQYVRHHHRQAIAGAAYDLRLGRWSSGGLRGHTTAP